MEHRVLIVDHDGAERAAITRSLTRAGLDVAPGVGSLADAEHAIRAHAPTLAVVDVDVLREDPAAAMARLYGASAGPLAVVVAAATGDAASVAELAGTGPVGFVAKGDPDDVVAAARIAPNEPGYFAPHFAASMVDEVARLYREQRDRNAQLEEMVAQLQALSITDWLTGLRNHGYFFQRLGEEIDRALRHRRSMALLLGDLDDFKRLNDGHGHAAGDRVLRMVGEVLAAELRSADIACRIGGEEFALLLPETDGAGALLVADRVRRALADAHVPGVGPVTISFGVAAVPEHAIGRDDLVELADRALYLAKREGKNRSRLAGQPLAMAGPPLARPLRGEMVELVVRVLRQRAPGLAAHALATAEAAVVLGTRMAMSSIQLEHLRLAALLQGLGMVALPDSVLFKPGPLTEEEWELVRDHPRRGFEIVDGFVPPDVAAAVLANHEHYDGSGYPGGLLRGDIPLVARVLLVADAFAAMTGERPFRPALGPSAALAELHRNAGTQFDPAVVDAFANAAVRPFPKAAGE